MHLGVAATPSGLVPPPSSLESWLCDCKNDPCNKSDLSQTKLPVYTTIFTFDQDHVQACKTFPAMHNVKSKLSHLQIQAVRFLTYLCLALYWSSLPCFDTCHWALCSPINHTHKLKDLQQLLDGDYGSGNKCALLCQDMLLSTAISIRFAC